ncbi:hypothetical protein GGX14DRAFT_604964 [Mycena pura]|uniref:SAP domain-containing protein n=1 Tax=Mycena pura TaxID=153505 RepID=A0AAD6VLK1_9AGAR|nr:hypothetical protein GGX14DRAFT_604964 [Mycena pura]
MSTTTEILFNSPALHSLKRDQLVKLCKIHALKANGKNVELVERLKTHAKNLPNDNPLSVALRSEQEGAPETQDDEADRPWMPRPSSQWEVVMDSIMEESEDGSSQGTLSSLKSGTTFSGEFGADSGSSKSTTVSSSIRALASSLGLKRHATGSSTASSKASVKLISSFPLPPSADELTKNSTPYDALPPSSSTDLQTDHFTFDTSDPVVVAAHLNPHLGTAPLPGHSLRPGVPAPINARLSLGLAPRTPSKRGPTTTIRLVSMDATAPKARLPPQGGTPNLKPFQTTFDLDLGSPSAPAFPQSIYPALPASPPVDEEARRMSLEASQHISLGTEVDEDKNEDVPMPGAFGFGASPSTPPNTAKPSFMFGSPSPQPVHFSFQMTSPGMETKAKLAADVMEEMNRRAFGESGVGETLPPTAARDIRPLPGSARKAGSKAKPSGRFSNVHQQMFEKMESIADLAAKREGLKRKSSAMSIRVANTAAAKEPEQGRGKRVRVDEAGSNKRNGEADDEDAAEKKKQAEREAMRKKLEISRARRRSSAANGGARRMSGRVSGVLVKPKPASRGRFGFFAGAAKLVQGVWGGKKAAPPAPSGSAASTTQKPAFGAKPPVAGSSKMGPPPVPSARASADAKSLRPPSVRSMASTRSTTVSRARSPLPPSFIGTSSKSTASSARTRNSSIAGASSVGTRTSSASGSMGTRSSLNIGSLGTRGSFSSTNTPGSTVDSTRKTASRPLSRLLAPTASSLAKMNVSPSVSPSPLPAVVEKQDARVLEGITNTTAASDGAAAAIAPAAPATAKGKAKLLPAPARKPRISRSRVIAKLASQRVASGSSVASASTAASASRKSLATGRTRSSLGTKVQRGSLGGIRNGPGGPLDAKRRARQSEYYARRRSRVEQAQDADTMKVEP